MSEETRESADRPGKQVHAALDHLMPELRGLDWSKGLTRDDVPNKVPAFPDDVYMFLPSERRFLNLDDLVLFYRHALQRSTQRGISAAGAYEEGGPAAWGSSPPSSGARAVGETHGVGSGADSGYTGSDDVGTGRSGASYGPGSTEPDEE